MGLRAFIEGLIVGIVVAIPIGPVGFLCAQRTLLEGRLHGLTSGLGAASADALYASLAAFGLTIISDFMVEQQLWLRVLGGIFLCIIGIRAFVSKAARKQISSDGMRHVNNFGSAFFVTLSNPMTFIMLTGAFAGLGLVSSRTGYASAGSLVAGVFAGSMLWWLLLSVSVGIFHKKIGDDKLCLLGNIFGAILTVLGLLVILSTML